jgi:hypothetical protein
MLAQAGDFAAMVQSECVTTQLTVSRKGAKNRKTKGAKKLDCFLCAFCVSLLCAFA